MSEQVAHITEKTLVPLGLLASIIGLVFWVSGIYYTGIANAKAIEKLTQQQMEYNAVVYSIDKRLSIIESKVTRAK